MLTREELSVKVSSEPLNKRCLKIIQYIVHHQNEIENCGNGNISFNFTGSTLKAKIEKYENL